MTTRATPTHTSPPGRDRDPGDEPYTSRQCVGGHCRLCPGGPIVVRQGAYVDVPCSHDCHQGPEDPAAPRCTRCECHAEDVCEGGTWTAARGWNPACPCLRAAAAERARRLLG